MITIASISDKDCRNKRQVVIINNFTSYWIITNFIIYFQSLCHIINCDRTKT